ncbi:hypothetical protein Rhopal_002395-T1 [Rhodotorula paludigena]|uniref:Metallo-beta-lactamase domain-containing protein n=1 Tax=Rhodotorula paludigena TaxID=86838 RepID=A0AAV5GIV1_9BASI|nr:hypothetical protein Rhopal_002395-T1 [Rhodotorula paludigena]
MSLSPYASHHRTVPLLGIRKFRNPWPSANSLSLEQLVTSGPWLARPLTALEGAVEGVKRVVPDWGHPQLEELGREGSGGEYIRGTWLGHAGAFVEIPLEQADGRKGPRSLKLLFDPIFSLRAGPTSFFGPKRMHEAPCAVSDLPGVDVVFISHNHYDHLDLATILEVQRLWPRTRYFAGLGNKPWFVARGIPPDQVFEMDWWDEVNLPSSAFPSATPRSSRSSAPSALSSGAREAIRITCVPAQHESDGSGKPPPSRRPTPPRWFRKGAVYHAGDTGYRSFRSSPFTCPVFPAIGQEYGPFDLAFIPIWRGGTLGFVSALGLRLCHRNLPSAMHTSPTDAVRIHREVCSRNTVGIHFGTFQGSPLEALEALQELEDACSDMRVGDLRDPKERKRGRMGRLDIGETYVVKILEQEVVEQ